MSVIGGVQEETLLSLVAQTEQPNVDLLLAVSDGLSFFVRAIDVVTFVPVQSLSSQEQVSLACGFVEFNQQSYSVFCFNESFQLQPIIPSSHKAILLLNDRGSLFGISCAELTKTNSENNLFFAVPKSMRSRKQPFTQFSIINDNVIGLSSAAELHKLLILRGVKLPVLHEPASDQYQGVV